MSVPGRTKGDLIDPGSYGRNAFAILGRVKKALLKAGADKEYASKYMKEAMAGDYDNLLAVTMDYADVI